MTSGRPAVRREFVADVGRSWLVRVIGVTLAGRRGRRVDVVASVGSGGTMASHVLSRSRTQPTTVDERPGRR